MPDLTNVHVEHCCFQHGCKYKMWDEDKWCPVEEGVVLQAYPCEICAWMDEREQDNPPMTMDQAFEILDEALEGEDERLKNYIRLHAQEILRKINEQTGL